MNHNLNKYLSVLVGISLCVVLGYGVGALSAGRSFGSQKRLVAFYQDSMHPWVKANHPGACPICRMALTPVYEGEKGFQVSDSIVVLSSNSVTVLAVQSDVVNRQPLIRTLRVAGTLDANETRKTVISAPIASRIHNLAVPYAGVEVAEGQTLVTLFSPDFAQKRAYLRAVGINQPTPSNDVTLVDQNTAPFTSQLTAPQAGVVLERTIYNGQYVAEGEKLMTLADASVLWFRFDVYERQLPWFAVGQALEVTVTATPGRIFHTVISFIDPTVTDASRAVKARADIANPVISTNGPSQRALRFGMYAEGRLHAAIPNVLAVPRSAILFPGGSAYTYVDKGEGAYERRRVKLGRQGDTCWEVLQGLAPGERVVTSGNVLIDAQAQFRLGSETHADDPFADVQEAETLSTAPEETPPPAAEGKGVVRSPQPAKNMALNHYQASLIRMGVRDELWKQRSALIAAAHGKASPESVTDPLFIEPKLASADTNAAVPFTDPGQVAAEAIPHYTDAAQPILAESNTVEHYVRPDVTPLPANTNQLSVAQHLALHAYLATASDISQALASDDLKQFNVHIARLPGLLATLCKEIMPPDPWAGAVQGLNDLARGVPARTLDEARNRFTRFSIPVVALARKIRKENATFAGLKVYRCLMANEPMLWIQEKGPVRNPFYGAEMLTCGEEVVQ